MPIITALRNICCTAQRNISDIVAKRKLSPILVYRDQCTVNIDLVYHPVDTATTLFFLFPYRAYHTILHGCYCTGPGTICNIPEVVGS